MYINIVLSFNKNVIKFYKYNIEKGKRQIYNNFNEEWIINRYRMNEYVK